jgi:hypothetical protein
MRFAQRAFAEAAQRELHEHSLETWLLQYIDGQIADMAEATVLMMQDELKKNREEETSTCAMTCTL